MMMSQRKRDIGLMKAVGCPNEMIFGYFFTELLIVTFVGCLIGVIFGLLADFASASVFGGFGSQLSQFHVDFWPTVLVFGVFLGLSLAVGAKPIFDVSRMRPAEAISPSFCVGLSKESSSKVLSRSRFTRSSRSVASFVISRQQLGLSCVSRLFSRLLPLQSQEG